jgi:drug/metabolite transporter (DMT)-like permease
MSTPVLLAVLAAALMHASWNALIRGAPDKALYTVLLHACSAALAMLLLPLVGLPDAASWPYVGVSVLLHSVYIALLMRAYNGGQLAVSYMLMRGLAPLLVCLVSAPVLSEPLGLLSWLGVLGILAGIGLIASASGQPMRAVLRHPSGRAAMLNAVFIAAYTVVDGQGARVSGNPLGYVLVLALFEPMAILCMQLRRRPAALMAYARAHWPLGLMGAATATGAYATVLWAMTLAPIAMVAAVRESAVIFAVLIGSLWFKEGRLAIGLAAACLMATGIAAIR